MRNKLKIGGIMSVLILGTCSVPFLPITQHEYLKSYEKKIMLGPYEIEARILLFDNQDETEMTISATFTYPSAQMKKDGCYMEVVADLEGQTPQTYPSHITGTKYEKNFTVENLSDSSFDDLIDVAESRRLRLNMYNEPIVEQMYTLNLKPVSGEIQKSCSGTKVIKHKIRKTRASMFDVAMSV